MCVCFFSSLDSVSQFLSISRGPYWGGRGTSCSAVHIRLTLEEGEMLPFLPQPFYGGLMIYCSGFSLFSSYLEGGQFNKHACFLPRPSDSSHSHRNVLWCHCVHAQLWPSSETFSPEQPQQGAEKSSSKKNLMGAVHRCTSPKHKACLWSPGRQTDHTSDWENGVREMTEVSYFQMMIEWLKFRWPFTTVVYFLHTLDNRHLLSCQWQVQRYFCDPYLLKDG